MKPYAELLEFNQPNPIRKPGFTRIRDAFPGLASQVVIPRDAKVDPGNWEDFSYAQDPERIMEFAGRWDYGENNARKLGETVVVQEVRPGPYIDGSPATTVAKKVPIIQKYIDMGHESMIEMGDATFFIECSRVVSHELVRHRIASFQQESQRFSKVEGDLEDVFYIPEDADGPATRSLLEGIQFLYNDMQRVGVAKQLARYILPNATRTRLIMKTNVREWRHILRLRLDKSAQPEMQVLAQQIYDQLVDVFPNAMAGVLDGGRGVR